MKQRINMMAGWLLSIVLLTGLDQYTKKSATQHLKGKEPFVLIDGVFELLYSENRGAAFGIFQEKQMFFFITGIVVCACLIFAMWRMAATKSCRYIWLEICTVLLASGAIGNMLDRTRQEYVVDFLYFKLINFPIFNVADIYVTVSAFYLFFLVGFVYKEEELTIFRLKRKEDKLEGKDSCR